MSKRILITGSTDGIGKHLATKLVAEGHEVLLHGRNAAKLEATVAELSELATGPKPTGYRADLSHVAEVHGLVEQVKSDFDSLDVLINNAGISTGEERSLTENNVELGFMISVLAPYILTNGLRPLLAASGDARVIYTSSFIHHYAQPYSSLAAATMDISVMDPDLQTSSALDAKVEGLENELPDFALDEHYNPARSYANAKLYAIWLTRYQARQFAAEGLPITVNTYHPGLVATKLTGFPTDQEVPASAMPENMVTIDEGIRTGYRLALSDDFEGVSGEYVDEFTGRPASDKGYTPKAEAALIDYLEAHSRA
ncbi:MAG: SDR family NAD(P)-dependent oxidoreductase [Corynebacterium sp.]|nr:SDR family NAD(P)-dependent oxidoreductase [Corynebacterium sp.]